MCRCEEERGLEPGWLCGDPECYRTKAAEQNLRSLKGVFQDFPTSGEFKLPDLRNNPPIDWKR
jgi:hypothetical protein